MLAISPNGDAAHLAITRAIVALAPDLGGWEIHAAKPPRQWQLGFEIGAGTPERTITIDGTRWETVPHRLRDGRYDLVFRPDAAYGAAVAEQAAEILVEGELGEAARIELVRNVEVVASWDERAATLVRRLAPGLLATLVRRTN